MFACRWFLGAIYAQHHNEKMESQCVNETRKLHSDGEAWRLPAAAQTGADCEVTESVNQRRTEPHVFESGRLRLRENWRPDRPDLELLSKCLIVDRATASDSAQGFLAPAGTGDHQKANRFVGRVSPSVRYPSLQSPYFHTQSARLPPTRLRARPPSYVHEEVCCLRGWRRFRLPSMFPPWMQRKRVCRKARLGAQLTSLQRRVRLKPAYFLVDRMPCCW
jgi:hypothetical protein